MRPFLIAAALLLIAGCTSYGQIVNEPLANTEEKSGTYSIQEYIRSHDYGEVGISLAFSGGGTRAAALAYGVLMELRDTVVVVNGRQHSLLDEIDWGAVGLAQVAGHYYITPRQKLRYDRIYARHASLGFDLKLIFLAFLLVFYLRWTPGGADRIPRKWLH